MFLQLICSIHGHQSWGDWGGHVQEWGDEYLIIPPLFNMFNEILFLGNLKT
jgi:hypothetical protein